ncbi:MAG: glycosyltransferase family 9 protein [bacterium]
MPKNSFFSRKLYNFLKKFLAVEENTDRNLGYLKNILVIRQHNQFGDLLASVSLFRAIKETYPKSKLTVIVSPENHYAVEQNEFIDTIFLFNKKKLLNPFYIAKIIKLFRAEYDATVVPVTVAISFTSCLLARLSNSKTRIGPASLDGSKNRYDFLFDRKVHIDWTKNPDAHVSDYGLDIVRPFGIKTKNYLSSISFNAENRKSANDFINSLSKKGNDLLIGMHIGAGKAKNRWSIEKYSTLTEKLNKKFKVKIYITGSKSDRNEISFFTKKVRVTCGYFLDHSIPELAALISKSDLFITNDTGVMHVAGATSTPQISIFGPTNPFNWAPIGVNKYFLRKSELIDDVSVDDVFKLCERILT